MKLPRKTKKWLKKNSGHPKTHKGYSITYFRADKKKGLNEVWLRVQIWNDPSVSVVDKIKPIQSGRSMMLNFKKK
jgi:hypothetical protein